MKRSVRDKPTIVFLDSESVDYGDISFRALERTGLFKACRGTTPRNILSRTKDADVIIANKVVIDKELLGKLSRAKLVQVAATGVNNVDLDAARHAGIAVSNVGGYSTEIVSQCTFAFILALAGNLIAYTGVSRRLWSRSRFFSLPIFPIRELQGKTLGIVGYGRIGRRVKSIAETFRMRVLIAKLPGRRYPPSESVKRLPLARLARRVDFLTIHSALTDKTRHLIDEKILRLLPRGAYLINMARGDLVSERALCSALKNGRLAAAASDVLSEEPPDRDHILLKAPNFYLTPHIAWASREARGRLIDEMAGNISAFMSGKKRNRVL